jgi:hypothetical protein
MYSSLPDRKLPLIGDDDGGQLLPLGSPKGNDLRGLFSTFAVIFNRGDFKYLSEGFKEETFWLLGPDSKNDYDSIKRFEPVFTSKAFNETGYFFMRTDWSENANYVAFDCGPHGWSSCGHAHADLLSFQLFSGTQPIIVDPGTYTYSGQLRDYFRGSDGHSTVKVDGFYPAIPDGPFKWKMNPNHELITWESNSEFDRVSGRMIAKVDWRHGRELLFIKPSLLLILDTIEGNGAHEVEIRFPLYGKQWRIRGEKCLLLNDHVQCSFQCLNRNHLHPYLLDSWISQYYGHKMPSYALLFDGVVKLPYRFIFFVNLSHEDYRVELLERQEHTCFRIVSNETDRQVFSYNDLVNGA